MYTQPNWSSLTPRTLDGAVGMTTLTGRVAGSGGIDPTEEVRITLAQLTARARQLAVGGGAGGGDGDPAAPVEHRLLPCNSQSLLDASERTVRTATQAQAPLYGPNDSTTRVPATTSTAMRTTATTTTTHADYYPSLQGARSGSPITGAAAAADMPPPFLAICPAAPMTGESPYAADAPPGTVTATRADARGRIVADTYPPHTLPTPASVDLFMSRQLGVDVQEQQRLLQHLHHRQAATRAEYGLVPNSADSITRLTPLDAARYTASSSSPTDSSSADAALYAHHGGDVSAEVSAAVAQVKAEVSMQSRAAQHQRLREQLQQREQAVFQTAWDPYFVRLQGALAGQELASTTTMLTNPATTTMMGEGGVRADGAELRRGRTDAAGLPSLLFGNSPQSILFARRAAAFALYVDTQPADAWMDCFADYVDEQQGEMQLRRASTTTNTSCRPPLPYRGEAQGAEDEGDVNNNMCWTADAPSEVLMAALWQTVRSVLQPIQRAGSSSATAMHYLAASRASLEDASLRKLLVQTCGWSAAQWDEQAVQSLPAQRVLDAIMCANEERLTIQSTRRAQAGVWSTPWQPSSPGAAASSPSLAHAWAHVYTAMRVGRYDAALLAAERLGSAAVTAALRRCEQEEEGRFAPATRANASELQSIYLEAVRGSPAAATTTGEASYDTADNPYEQAVLLLLLGGQLPTGTNPSIRTTAASASASAAAHSQRTLLQLCSHIAQSVEEALWLRLCCVRPQLPHSSSRTTRQWRTNTSSSTLKNTQGGDANHARGALDTEEANRNSAVQSLTQLHTAILDDLPSLATIMGGNPVRLASFLFHALMPSAAMRVLLAGDTTYVDGLHMAMCCHHAGLLHMVPETSSPPMLVGRQVMHYASLILLDWNTQRARDGLTMHGSTIYNYFHKIHCEDDFVELCQQPTVCARLFGLPNYPYELSSLRSRRAFMGGNDDTAVMMHHKSTGSRRYGCNEEGGTHAQTRENRSHYHRMQPSGEEGGGAAESTCEAALTRDSAVPSADMLALLARVAERSAERRAVGQAIQVYMALAYAAHRAQNTDALRRALRRAVDLICSALAQTLASDAGREVSSSMPVDGASVAAHVSLLGVQNGSAAVTQLVACTTQLHAVTQELSCTVDHILTESQTVMFDTMYDMAYIYTLLMRNDATTALDRVLELRFLIQANQTAGGGIVGLAQTLREQPPCVVAALNGLMPYILHIAHVRLMRQRQNSSSHPQEEEEAFDAAIRSQQLRERVTMLCNALLMVSEDNPLTEVTCQEDMRQFLQYHM